MTKRQQDALYCFGEGMSYRETADLMLVSISTAEDYGRQLRLIFGVSHIRKLVPVARRYFRSSAP